MDESNSSSSKRNPLSDQLNLFHQRKTPLENCPPLYAIIEIGTTAIRMSIAELTSANQIRLIERLNQSVAIGKDTYSGGTIALSTIELAVKVLQRYRDKLNEYKIPSSQIHVVATSAIREAVNRLSFVDRIYIGTGLEASVLDEAEVHRIMYLGIQELVEECPVLKEKPTVFLEVGGGTSEFLVLDNDQIVTAHGLRHGSLRLRQALQATGSKLGQLMSTQIYRTVRELMNDLEKVEDFHFVAMGGDIRFATRELLGHDLEHPQVVSLPVEKLKELVGQLLLVTPEELVHRYYLSLPEAETLAPALLTYQIFAEAMNLKELKVCTATIRNGLLREAATGLAWNETLIQQLTRSAIEYGRKFEFDEAHACQVQRISEKLLEQLSDVCQINPRHFVILSIAALLHEIGLFIGTTGYHKHSQYLIQQSELFGLSRAEVTLVGLVARYHRRASPKPSHNAFTNLSRDDRVLVMKLAAILRLAVSLDSSRSQRIEDFQCQIQSNRLILEIAGVDDLAMEQLSLKEYGKLFQEVFGLQVQYRQVNSLPQSS